MPKKVIIGMDGKMESLVAAYLLKKQGFKCLGLTVSFNSTDKRLNEIMAPWMPEDLDYIKGICDSLEIPYYATDGSGDFFDSIIDNLIKAKLQGERYNPLQDFNRIVVSKLMSKKDELNADFIATGHFAKIYKNEITNEFHLLTSNEVEFDESYGVSSIPVKHYENLQFPLSDLRREEANKIYELVGIKLKKDFQEAKNSRKNFDLKEEVLEVVEKYTPPSLLKEGTVYSHYDGRALGDHDGYHKFYVGQSKMNFRTINPIDKSMRVVRIIPQQSMIYLDREEKFKYTHIFAKNFVGDPNLDLSRPLSCYVQLSSFDEKVPCKLFFKNNNFLIVDFEKEIPEILGKGTRMTFYKRKGVGAKVLGSARMHRHGLYRDGEFRYLPQTKDEEDVIKKTLVDTFDLRF